MDELELENMLQPFSQAISTRILRDANGISRGVGFARYEHVSVKTNNNKNNNKNKKQTSLVII